MVVTPSIHHHYRHLNPTRLTGRLEQETGSKGAEFSKEKVEERLRHDRAHVKVAGTIFPWPDIALLWPDTGYLHGRGRLMHGRVCVSTTMQGPTLPYCTVMQVSALPCVALALPVLGPKSGCTASARFGTVVRIWGFAQKLLKFHIMLDFLPRKVVYLQIHKNTN
ncbi:hypothetical protein R6Q59_028343 [Mikania micrantha]